MKTSSLIVFLITTLLFYALINFHIIRRGFQALSGMGKPRYVFLAVSLFLALSYPAGRFAERLWRSSLTEFFIIIGSFYIGLMIYLWLMVMTVDILRVGNIFFHFFPSFLTRHPQKAGQMAAFAVLAMAAAIVAYGHINSLHPRLKTLDLAVDKQAGGIQSLNIVLVSDIHLGKIVGNGRLEKIVKTINIFKPDLVLMPGDIVDEDFSPSSAQKMAATLQKIHAPLGVFSVTGNHEYFGGLERNVGYLSRGKVKVLEDEAVRVSNSFYVIGRKDRTAIRFGERRKSFKEILEGVDSRLPLILMDHQPLSLEEAEKNGIDLELSGHTHNGQIFPLNLINKRVYEINWGYLRKGRTHYYVTCGVGTWGPPLRIASHPEIVQIRIKFK